MTLTVAFVLLSSCPHSCLPRVDLWSSADTLSERRGQAESSIPRQTSCRCSSEKVGLSMTPSGQPAKRHAVSLHNNASVLQAACSCLCHMWASPACEHASAILSDCVGFGSLLLSGVTSADVNGTTSHSVSQSSQNRRINLEGKEEAGMKIQFQG